MQETHIEDISLLHTSQLKAKHYFTGKPFNMRRELCEANRLKMAKLMLQNCTHITFPHQTHGDNIVIIDHHNKNQIHANTDALITATKGIPIGVVTADCVPILIHDEENNVVAAIHSGWRGTQKEISRKTIGIMMQKFNSKPEILKVAIGPSISPSVYEVGIEVREKFLTTDKNYGTFFKPRENNKYLFDLWDANAYQLRKAGINTKHIYISKTCTFTQNHKFYSARRDGVETGRNAAVIMISNK